MPELYARVSPTSAQSMAGIAMDWADVVGEALAPRPVKQYEEIILVQM